MKKYNHLSRTERVLISELKAKGLGVNKIAVELNRSKSTISRELNRNCHWNNGYSAEWAHDKSRSRRWRGNMIDRNHGLRFFIVNKLTTNYWTPEQIAGFLKYRQDELKTVSHETIYRWMYGINQIANKYWKFLPRHKRKRGLRKVYTERTKKIVNRLSIHDRPEEILSRQEFGHWEGDLMSFQYNSQHTLVMHERKTRYIKSSILDSKQASITSKAVINLMNFLPVFARKTLTLDNGGEFKDFNDWRALGLVSYFCDPYSSWQKGGVENSNGRLRRVLPRSTDLFSLKADEFITIIRNHNLTPRKILGWKCPAEVFDENLYRINVEA